MSTVILTTVGTSLLSNANREGYKQDEEILGYIAQSPNAASAETNSLRRIMQKDDEIVLLHSDTDDGKRAAELLERYWQQQGVPCSRVRIAGLAYEAQGFADYGLKNFVRTLAGEIRKAERKQKEVIINATGGFKAEIAYATALGLVFKVPVCYIHEKFQEIITLPPSPFGWDSSLIAWNSEFFDWIDAELRPTAVVRSRAAPMGEEVEVLLEDTPDGYTMLSPLGQAYYEAFKAEFERAQQHPIFLSKRARRDWEGFDPSTQARYRRVLERLRLPNRISQSELKHGGGDALAFPKGKVDERVFYAEKDGALYVFALVQHGPEYDKLCRQGVRWSDHPQEEFTPWEG